MIQGLTRENKPLNEPNAHLLLIDLTLILKVTPLLLACFIFKTIKTRPQVHRDCLPISPRLF